MGGTMVVAGGSVSSSGYQFKYFISPTGLDSNAGNLAHPWSLNAINTKASTYAGNALGIIGDQGVYNLASVTPPINYFTSGFTVPTLQVAVSTNANSPTIIASCNSSGQYVQGLAVLDGGQNGTVGTSGNPFIATNGNVAGGNVIIDGLEVRNCLYIGIRTGGIGSIQHTGCVIQNCYVHSVYMQNTGAPNSGNGSGIQVFHSDGTLIKNNFVTDVIDLYGALHPGTARADGIKTFACTNMTIDGNTIYANATNQQPTSGIATKDTNQYNNTIIRNFVHLLNAISGAENNTINMSCDSGPPGFFMKVQNNILVTTAGYGCTPVGSQNGPPPPAPNVAELFWIGNTCYAPNGGGGLTRVLAPGNGTVYNNITQRVGSTSYRGDVDFPVDALALSDYNVYPASPELGTSAANGGSVPVTLHTTVAAYAATMAPYPTIGQEAHSHAGAATFINGSGTMLKATDYKIAATSPVGHLQGSTNGLASGQPCDNGAWGQQNTIGCQFRDPS